MAERKKYIHNGRELTGQDIVMVDGRPVKLCADETHWELVSVTEFNDNNTDNAKSGLQSYCKGCSNTRKRDRAAKAAGRPAIEVEVAALRKSVNDMRKTLDNAVLAYAAHLSLVNNKIDRLIKEWEK